MSFTELEKTEERVEAYLASLKAELSGNKAKQAQAKSVGDETKVAYWATRIEAVESELARFLGKSKKAKTDPAPEPAAV